MILVILLVISIILQIIAAGTAIRLTRVTKYNSSWILFTIALTFLVLQRFLELLEVSGDKTIMLPKDFLVWIGVATSLCFAVGVFMIKKVLTYIGQMEQKRRLTEKRILNTIISTEEKERQRFSKDLHDGLGPLLSSVKMSVSALAQMEQDASKKEIIQNTDYVINEAIKSLKEISNNLSPHILNNFGLARAVTNFINRLTLPDSLRINFQTNLRAERFDNNVEVILYRVLCELINNTIKHAGAGKINIRLMHEGEVITIAYHDNGRGFDPARATAFSSHKGMGLSNIVSRISSLKGTIQIDSKPGEGVRIFIKVNPRS